MIINIQVIKVKDKHFPSTKGGYNMAEVTYQNLSQGGKTEGKKLFSFGDYAAVYEAAKNWEEDQVVTIQNEKVYSQKDSRDYWTWVAVVDGEDNSHKSEQGETVVAEVNTKTTKAEATKQQWVPDEVKQRLIVRQSSIAQAVALEKDNSPTIDIILNTAQKFFDWVFENDKPGKAAGKKKAETPSEVE